MLPRHALAPVELCLHCLLKNGVLLFVTVALLCSIQEDSNAARAVGCLPLKIRSVGGKVHGLVVLVDRLEQL